MRTTTLLLALLIAVASAQAQRSPALTYTNGEGLALDTLVRLRYYATDIGAGFGNVLDTYLSPYSYTGLNIRFQHEYARWTRRCAKHQPRITYHTQIVIDGNIIENPAGNRNEYAGGVRYTTAWRYHFNPLTNGRLHLSAGPLISVYGGCVYNEHDGNNPAQAKASITLDANATAAYRLRILHTPCLLTYNLDIPLLGAVFSPQYGQSYYEIFTLGHYDHNAVFTTPLNLPSLRHQLTLHISLNAKGSSALRITYASDIMQAKTNNLRYHAYTHALMIGISKTLFRL